MKARDVMVRNVITVAPNALVQEVANVLLSNGISAAPVVNENGKLLGIVSEGDLMRRPEAGTERRRSWWLQLLTTEQTLAAEFAKSHAQKIADVMTRKVVTARPDTSLAEIADLLVSNAIKRVPIVSGGKVVGIVSRANLLEAVARKQVQPTTSEDDATLRERIVERIKTQPWAQSSTVNVDVHEGVVELSGFVDSQAQKMAMRVAAEAIPGVRAVNNNLIIRPMVSGA